MRRRRTSLPALSALAALLLGGCGVPETGVIEAGAPAEVEVYPYPPNGMVLFLRSLDGRLMPVIRFVDEALGAPDSAEPSLVDTPGPGVSTPQTLAELFAGPRPGERRAGLTDGLPEFPYEGVARSVSHPGGGVEVMLPVALAELDDLGVRQVVCTVAFTEDAEGRTEVRLRGTDVALPPAVCDAGVDLRGVPTPTATPTASSPPAGA
ncbi:hypothetical protein [Streptomyces sp. JJ38]|uniref:hypothetical protein n=1 Tax=Streptomyces sp. JJ38 TaxID=2738128 RepID=UPI001C57F240|nr:hypothetical protein [Streptomyces sp. JJ38]MBW1598527.1 hypothetical protein [Streptomyces sp. JJ38]